MFASPVICRGLFMELCRTLMSLRQMGGGVQSLSHVWLCDPMDRSTPAFPVLHYLPEPAQTHVRWVGDAIQPSRPLSSPSPPPVSLCQHQGLFQWAASGVEYCCNRKSAGCCFLSLIVLGTLWEPNWTTEKKWFAHGRPRNSGKSFPHFCEC